MNLKIPCFELETVGAEEKRLLYSSFIVFLVFSLVVSHLYTRNMLWQLLGADQAVEIKSKAEKEKVYEVLLEQDYVNPEVKDEIKAYSDVEAAGSGGLTDKKGFHTDSRFREFIMGSSSFSGSSSGMKMEVNESDVNEVGIFHSSAYSSQSSAAVSSTLTKIPFNYRFQQDFRFRWDGAKALSIPRKKLAGFLYFKRMLKTIESSFAPPGGGNFAYRDSAGYVIRQGIKSGETKVVFMLSPAGDVIDIKLLSSQGQDVVDRACLDSIRTNNFGTVPPEVRAQGMIFGINFVFPGR